MSIHNSMHYFQLDLAHIGFNLDHCGFFLNNDHKIGYLETVTQWNFILFWWFSYWASNVAIRNFFDFS